MVTTVCLEVRVGLAMGQMKCAVVAKGVCMCHGRLSRRESTSERGEESYSSVRELYKKSQRNDTHGRRSVWLDGRLGT